MKQKIANLLPAFDLKNIRIFYFLTAFTSFWFLAANWLFFWLKFMNYQQLGIIDAITFGAGLLMEIPSGAISDLVGKKKTIVLGTGTAFFSIILMASAQNIYMLFIAQLFLVLGWALNSGSLEALVYDSLLEKGREKEYEKVMSVSSSLASFITIGAIFIGGFLYEFYFRLPTFAWGITWGIAFLLALKLREPKIDSEVFSWSNYWKQLKTGTLALLKPELISFSVVIFSLMGGYFLYDFGFLKPALATAFGFNVFQQSSLFAFLALVGASVVLLVPWLRKRITDRKGLYLLTFMLGTGFVIAYFFNNWLGIISLLLIDISGYLVYPWISVVINQEIESKHRATSLSAVALLSKVPYVFLSIIAGTMANNSEIGIFSWWIGIFILSSVIISTLIYKIGNKKSRLV
ncbi:MAG: hypothetical protein CO040_02325 [Candidatus Pacebacteria bacterium CG_4_9_14_0_2_um_filter_36_8]|nr:MFS transporter [Candidatus Pacearchaeota archaeon]OIP74574.1 MAG: hypothetical protein AUK08_00485 [Candidatus Pacebacteria bacterium CG2_30_36_39]PJC42836.1 MAG: hypothetical protein CO040_02325 [Candidatus Pacebacteria bacterium CG_4_9_14_0_2_um_filter_36_8]